MLIYSLHVHVQGQNQACRMPLPPEAGRQRDDNEKVCLSAPDVIACKNVH